MKRVSVFLVIALFAIFLCTGVSRALTLGENITINDLMPNEGIGQGGEDNECEQGMVQSQAWDLEGFFLDSFMLAIVGGYDFANLTGYTSGDIFIDIDGDVIFGGDDASSLTLGNNDIGNSFGYDYVLDLDFTNFTYNVIAIDQGATLTSVHYNNQNNGSNPWQYNYGGTAVDGFQNLSFDYFTGFDDVDVGLNGWTVGDVDSHNAGFFDVSFLGYGTTFTAHNTMGCGNDNLMGYGTTPVPEPGTVVLMLFGAGILLGGQRLRRRLFF